MLFRSHEDRVLENADLQAIPGEDEGPPRKKAHLMDENQYDNVKNHPLLIWNLQNL